jgi:hypothetical protein
MPSPGQGGDITLVRTGAHKITIDPSGTPKTAGFTHGNLTFTITVNKRDVLVAEYGTTPADIEITGSRCTVKWTMIERSLKILDIALQGLYPFGYQNSSTLSRGVGRSGVQRASVRGKTILLHPLSQGSATVQDITLQQAIITPTGNVELSDQGDQLWEVEADCIVSPSASDGELLAIINESNVGQ